MARRVYLSFLGTSEYKPCTYEFDKQKIENVKFVQIATMRLFCQEWNTNDRAYIFVTDQAKKANWLDDGHKDRETGEIIKCEGLSTCIEKEEFNFEIEPVKIPFGVNEDEIWEIFQTVFDCLKQGDEIIFDITHSFRSIPMLAIVVLNYAKVVKKVKLSGIYYGAFEARDKNNVAPILDLTAFDELLAWSQAIDRFLDAGDAGLLSKLAVENVKAFKKIIKRSDKAEDNIKNISKALKKFTEIIATCRGMKITEQASKINNTLINFDDIETIRIKPFQPLIDSIKEQMKPFGKNEILDGVQAAKWCLEHNMIQQGLTILQEIIVCYLLLKIGVSVDNKLHREIASKAINILFYETEEERWDQKAKQHANLTQKYCNVCKSEIELVKKYVVLTDFRNDMNHAGYRPNPKPPETFVTILEELIPWAIDYFGHHRINTDNLETTTQNGKQK